VGHEAVGGIRVSTQKIKGPGRLPQENTAESGFWQAFDFTLNSYVVEAQLETNRPKKKIILIMNLPRLPEFDS
jgi:hypothetical protein